MITPVTLDLRSGSVTIGESRFEDARVGVDREISRIEHPSAEEHLPQPVGRRREPSVPRCDGCGSTTFRLLTMSSEAVELCVDCYHARAEARIAELKRQIALTRDVVDHARGEVACGGGSVELESALQALDAAGGDS